MEPSLPLRLRPGDDLRVALEQAFVASGAQAAFVVAGIGSLSGAMLRLAGASGVTTLEGDLEILTLSGTLSPNGAHLHVSVSDAEGRVVGGHVSVGCIVRTTAEVLIAPLPRWSFTRVLDPVTGYGELVVKPRTG